MDMRDTGKTFVKKTAVSAFINLIGNEAKPTFTIFACFKSRINRQNLWMLSYKI